ncbi:DNA-binding Xre family transcriptional regulator [Ureibacillus xyleni]|uniref:DNA-binding Xre family transcriptional regulator n=1 Tax=Ureibacillus xyleni TaxID=614648 RepID=A0A285T1C2_9BACL|nr:DNA-binding Xre family transcriptional regulator [Ureibacillus xyleni]
MEIEVKLKQLLKQRNMKQIELANLTGLTPRSISELANNQVERIPRKALLKIAEALSITDIREIIDFKLDEQ